MFQGKLPLDLKLDTKWVLFFNLSWTMRDFLDEFYVGMLRKWKSTP